MPTILLRLMGPMQSWGTASRFDQRDTGTEPSKSGVIGLLAAALGITRENWTDLEPLTRLSMGVRHDRPGMVRQDYQTAGCAQADTIIKADGHPSKDGIVSRRLYLADAAFLVAMEGEDRSLIDNIQNQLKNPTWTLALGRKSYVPTEPISIDDGIQDAPMLDVLTNWPWISSQRRWEDLPEKLLISYESKDETGRLRMDQPLASFAERRFGARFISSEWIPFPKEAINVSA
jgi:CRISPR system Cascade subunit CasD